MTLKIGLTGGIGSGKTTVANVFAAIGIPVLFSDDVSKKIMAEDGEVMRKITESFGEKSYSDGRLNRAYLASVVFTDPQKLAALNAIVHPATIAFANKWMEAQTAPYAIKEAALIFEAKADKYLDYVIGVSAPAELRIKRTMERDQVSREKVLERMQHQLDEEEKMSRCDFIIQNDEKHLLIPQVLAIDKQLRERAGQ